MPKSGYHQTVNRSAWQVACAFMNRKGRIGRGGGINAHLEVDGHRSEGILRETSGRKTRGQIIACVADAVPVEVLLPRVSVRDAVVTYIAVPITIAIGRVARSKRGAIVIGTANPIAVTIGVRWIGGARVRGIAQRVRVHVLDDAKPTGIASFAGSGAF